MSIVKNFTLAGTVPRYALLKSDGSGGVVVTTAATETPICATDGQAGVADDVLGLPVDGIVKVAASAAIALHALVMPAAGGKVVTYSAGGTNRACGRAFQEAKEDGHAIDILLFAQS